jgi:CheY-like chemotaxis protein
MIASIQHTPRTPSVLAIEPDPDRAHALTQLVHDYIDAKVVVSASADVAVAVIAKRIPDLILMSAFTPPSEERTLIEFLRQTTEVNVPVLMVWPIFERRSEKTSVSSSLYRVLRRTPQAAAAPMRDAIGARMRVALETAREELRGTASGDADGSNGRAGGVHQAVCVPRAHRWTPRDLSWLTGVRLPSGYVRQLVNISNSGLLIECDSALMPGSSVTFQLCANGTELWHPNTDLMVPAHIVRSEVSKVDTEHLRYLVAARFQRELELPSKAPIPQEASEAPPALSDKTLAGSDVDAVALRAVERLQELARALESLESAVARICPRTRRERRTSRPLDLALSLAS